jgi:uncharacterized protein
MRHAGAAEGPEAERGFAPERSKKTGSMHLEVADNPDEDRYEIRADGELAGYLVYHRRGGCIALNHTEVLDGFEGKGVGSALIARTLDDLRERGTAVLPFCPFVKSFLERHPEYVDVVPEDERARYGL